MIKSLFVYLLYIISVTFIILVVNISSESIHDEKKVFIIYMGSLPEEEDYLAASHHTSLLQTLGHDKKTAEKLLVRSYGRSFNGFAANLTLEEVSKLESADEVISVFKSHRYHTQTTRSWDYMGLSLDVSRNPTLESDIIIGHFDTGVVSEAPSFSDHGLSAIPKKWKGVCRGGKNFTCNRKLIGARFYSNSKDAVDIKGHGTHTASIAAGRVLKNANFYGIANGTARGGVPSARIATYKVCNSFCDGHDVLAGFDDAIADNVDIITISLNLMPGNISDDAISIGSFHAMEKEILTVNSAGNAGNHGIGTRTSIAPWVFSVAASKDRNILNKLVLGNGRTLLSTAVNVFNISSINTMLVDGRRATRKCNESVAIQCTIECVDPSLVKGKIILCDVDYLIFDVYSIVANAGASGVILRARIAKDVADIVPMPTAILNDSDFQYVESYLKSKTLHTARIINTYIDQNHAPISASFSNKGPNRILPGIFKPDITAPGIDILAAFSPSLNIVDPVKFFGRLVSNYIFKTGTSMACPHVAGAAAYVKSKHPDWSISAIKSSLMTTARNMNGKYNLNAELGHGAGHIDPVKAVYPGLVYETFLDDYYKMFCSLPEGDNLRRILRAKNKCSKEFRILPKDLNYPAMTSPVHTNYSFTIQFLRMVTNVGNANSTYKAEISSDDGSFNIKVEPNIISFTHLKERKSFVVTITGKWLTQDHVSSSLIWYDGTHRVRSPIILYRSTIV